MSGAFREAQQLARLVRSLNDRELAVRFLRYRLSELGTHKATALVAQVFAHAESGDSSARQLMLLLSVALATSDSLRAELAELAGKKGDCELVLRLSPPSESTSEALEVGGAEVGKARPLTLGERKSLARRRDRDLIARALRDPHPDVIRILLGNPALTEADVVRLCARRPIPSGVVREVFRSPRWIVRDAVRAAMARNPHTPRDVALSLVNHLALDVVRDIASSPELHPSLREACANRLRPRAIH